VLDYVQIKDENIYMYNIVIQYITCIVPTIKTDFMQFVCTIAGL